MGFLDTSRPKNNRRQITIERLPYSATSYDTSIERITEPKIKVYKHLCSETEPMVLVYKHPCSETEPRVRSYRQSWDIFSYLCLDSLTLIFSYYAWIHYTQYNKIV